MKVSPTFSNFSIIILAIFGFSFIFSIKLSACTVFNKKSDDKVLFGNVENEQSHYECEFHFIPPHQGFGHYGHYYIYYNGNIAGGMNDQGLCFDAAALPAHNAYNGKPHGDLMDYLLKKCATINDALSFFNNYYWPGHNVNHIMIMDKTGSSAIVELIQGTLYVFRKSGDSHIMTNYSIADPEIRYGDHPCPRFEKCHSMLDTMYVTVDNFQRVCEKISHAYYNALYTTIYDPNSLDIHIFNSNIQGSEITTFNLTEEYNKGIHHFIWKNNHLISDIPEMSSNLFSVSTNSPNPFSDQTSFQLKLSADAMVKIRIIDLHGQTITILEDERKQPGSHIYFWHASQHPKGVYFCRFNIEGIIETRKWVVY